MRTRISKEQIHGPLVQQVEEISGQDLLACNQCGRCSAGCPAVAAMDLLPSQVVRQAQLGLEETLECETIWICASCLTCVTRCPKGVDLPRLMEALRQVSLRRGVSRIDLSALPHELLRVLPQVAIVGACRKYTG
jgi:heterodisulfide reductase subunit C